jgi:hypothetical protein
MQYVCGHIENVYDFLSNHAKGSDCFGNTAVGVRLIGLLTRKLKKDVRLRLGPTWGPCGHGNKHSKYPDQLNDTSFLSGTKRQGTGLLFLHVVST